MRGKGAPGNGEMRPRYPGLGEFGWWHSGSVALVAIRGS